MPDTRVKSRHTKIVCTIGPSVFGIIPQLIRAGMNVARFNLSHATIEDHARHIAAVRESAVRLDAHVAILIDIPGTKYRVGKIPDDSLVLKKGDEVVLRAGATAGNGHIIPVNFASFAQSVKPGETVLLADGAMQLKVQSIAKNDVTCRVIVGGLLTPGRGVVVPGMASSGPYVTEKFRGFVDFAIGQRPDYIALSFVSHANDVEQVRSLLNEKNSDIRIISKIERGQAIANFDRLLAVSDAIMIARGDLGVDIPLQKVPLVQKELIRKSNRAAKPVITATQMMESMINAARPTRAEVTDVANAIFDGSDALMLSEETAVGKYPVAAVKIMDKIARETERQLPYEAMFQQKQEWVESQTDEVIAHAACRTAQQLSAAAIVAFTTSGATAQRVSKYRPKQPVLAVTPDQRVCGRLTLCWGVRSFQTSPPLTRMDDLFELGARLTKELGLARAGQTIVVTGGIPVGVPGATNLLKVETIK